MQNIFSSVSTILISDVIAFLALIVGTISLCWQIIEKRKKNEDTLTNLQFDTIIQLINHLNSNIIEMKLRNEDGVGTMCGVTLLNLPTPQFIDEHNNYCSVPVFLGANSNQLGDLRKFINNPKLPKEISIALSELYLNRTTVINDRLCAPKSIILETNIFEPVTFDPVVLGTFGYRKTKFTNYIDFYNTCDSLVQSLVNWCDKNKIHNLNIVPLVVGQFVLDPKKISYIDSNSKN